jgi:hypothetical protein
MSPRSVATLALAARPSGPLHAAAATDVAPNGFGLDVRDDPAPPPRTKYRITYHPNGTVMSGPTLVFFIWYGNWSADPFAPDSEQVILPDLVNNLGGSPYFGTARLYTDASGGRPDGSLGHGGRVVDAYSRGTSLSTNDVPAVVLSHIASGELPPIANAVYVLMPSADVSVAPDLGTTYCASHGSIQQPPAQPPVLRYAVVVAPGAAPGKCAAQSVGPNGTLGADASASLLAAVLFDAVTDPDLNAWYDHLGLEGADKCVWTFGTTYRAPNGALANVRLGTRNYLLQQLWVPAKNGGACALHA